jgi:hypothetical protein
MTLVQLPHAALTVDEVLASLGESTCDNVDEIVRREHKPPLLRWASLDMIAAVRDGSLAERNYADYLKMKVLEIARAQLHLEYRLRLDPETAPAQHAG